MSQYFAVDDSHAHALLSLSLSSSRKSEYTKYRTEELFLIPYFKMKCDYRITSGLSQEEES